MAALLPAGPLALRGSSMGGYLALVAAATALRAQAVVAICPAAPSSCAADCAATSFEFRADRRALDALLAEHDALRRA